MDKKLAKVLCTINQNTNLSKLDIKTKTGFSMTTVLNCVDKLQKYGLITCGTKDVKGGKAPAMINSSLCAYVVGLGYSDGYLRATRTDLKGNVEYICEKQIDETKESYDKTFLEIKKDYPPVAVGVISENIEYPYIGECVEKQSRLSGDMCEGLSSFYRYYSLKNNSETVVIYIDDKISILKSDEKSEHIDVNDLYSPIIRSDKGRLSYGEVLSKSEVGKRLKERYSASIDDLADSNDENIIAYRNRINLAVRDLVCMIDKLLNPKSIVIGGYLPENALKISEEETKATIFLAGDTSAAVGYLASAIALDELYYYG